MRLAWQGEPAPEQRALGATDWLRAGLRGTALGLNTFGCLGLLLLVRLVERPLFGLRRPLTPWITLYVCRSAFWIIGMGYRRTGRPLRHGGVVVANHVSWLDIFALNAGQRVYFVAKHEVRGWPGIGWLARATGTVFIRRERRAAAAGLSLIAERLRAGHQLAIFPEGTSTDGCRVLRFRSTFYEAFIAPETRGALLIQPVSLVYTPPADADPRHYGWWGGMDFAPHLVRVLATRRQGAVEVVYHAPIPAAAHPDRKTLARACEVAVRQGLAQRLGQIGGSQPLL